MSFYTVPNYIFNPIADRNICEGRIVLPLDATGELKEQLNKCGLTNIINASDETSYMDRDWWSKLPEFDWAVAITQGVGKTADWVLEPSYELAKKGLVILDRLTFLEPTRDRSNFLTSKPLSNLIILNPRPKFRADQTKSKDSVTSAWFVFSKTHDCKDGTNIEYEVSWQRPRSFI